MIANSNKPTVIHAALILIGFTSVIAQIILMRELIVVFHGNEISLGIILANWLLWTSLGSGLLGRLFLRVERIRLAMAGLQLTLALILPLTVVGVRVVKVIFYTTPGEVPGPGPMFLSSFLVISLFCIISGCLFAVGSRLFEKVRHSTTTQATSSVYLLEAVGSGFGGLFTSILLLRYLSSCEIALFLTVLNLLTAAALTLRHLTTRTKITGAILAFAGFAVASVGGQALENHTYRYLWRNLNVKDVRNSIYGNLAVISTEDTRSVVQNGWVLFTVPEPEAAEESVHFALLQHPLPRSLLLIGGGMNGSLMETLKHPSIQHVDYVELDPAILALYKDHFSNKWNHIESEPRITIHHLDGRLFLQRQQKKYDAIIVNLPDPRTAQLNRFYTTEFFRIVARHLSERGIFSFQVTGAENYISEELAAFLRCINKTLNEIFPEVVQIPGASIHFFASTFTKMLVTDSDILIERLRSRRLDTQYVREYYIPFRMMPDRMQDLQSSLHAKTDIPLNRDFTPVAYYFNVALWSTRFHAAYRQVFHTIAGVGFNWLLAATAFILLLIIGIIIRLRRGSQRLRSTAGISVACMGLTMIGIEVLLLLAFQAIYGFVYHQLAIIIAAFMAGMAVGSRQALHRFTPSQDHDSDLRPVKVLLAIQWIAFLMPVLLVAAFHALSGVSGDAGLFITSHILFPIMALLAGGLGGYQFPICSKVYFGSGQARRAGLGSVYAFDLVGACMGAIIFSAYLIPVFGFLKTALLMSLLNLAPILLLSVSLPGRNHTAGSSE
jgi:spermidine synthase